MENVTFIEIETISGTVTHAIIDRGNGEFTSMTKETYDAQQAASTLASESALTADAPIPTRKIGSAHSTEAKG